MKRSVVWVSRFGLASLALGALWCGGSDGGPNPIVGPDGAAGAGGIVGDASIEGSSKSDAGGGGTQIGAQMGGQSGQTDGGTSPGWLTVVDAAPEDSSLVRGDALVADGACVGEKRQVEQRPLDLYFMVDKTGSMNCHTGTNSTDCITGGSATTRWNALTQALTTFFESPSNVGKGAGLGLFPRPGAIDGECLAKCSDCNCAAGCGCGQSLCLCLFSSCVCSNMIVDDEIACRSKDYANPDVGIAPLPGNAQQIVSVIAAARPSGLTPTTASLDGALQYVKSWSASHTDRSVALVYATDGVPEGCDTATNTVAGAANIAKDAWNGAKTRTFVLGVGPHLESLNQIAAAGGTDKAYLVDLGGDVAGQFAKALDNIRAKAVSCEFKIPTPEAGTLDYGFVNVMLNKTGDAGASTLVKWVQSPDGCEVANGGWYYDNYQSPTTSSPSVIQLCPSTCEQLNTSTNAVEILIGCQQTEKDPQIK